MKTLKELLAEKADLDKRIESIRFVESEAALLQVREFVKTFGFTVEQVFPLPGAGRIKFKPKFKDPETGATWTGVGKPPKWIAGKDRSGFAIEPEVDVFARSEYDDPKNPFPVQ
jgi:DNA-binding protein H-NS